MAARSTANRVHKTTTMAIVIALVSCTPVFALPADTTATPAAAPNTATSPVKRATTTATPSSATSSSADATTTIGPRKPVEDSSAIDVSVDATTQAFRNELAARQTRLDAFMAQLDELDRELALAAEAYNAAVDRLSMMRARVASAEGDLRKAQDAYDFQTDVLDSRVNTIYRDGSFAMIEVLIDSKSLSDFVARVKFLNTIGMADAEIAKSLLGQKDYVEKQAIGLKDAETLAESLEFELRARQIEVLLRIQERQQMMAGAQGDLLQLLDQEASRRQIDEAALLREILAGAGKAGVTVEPGSPVETALAYHGVPYLWGGESTAGFDCSGLILFVFKQHNVELPHYSGSQFLLGEKIAPAALAAGDVVFFGSPIHHVGMYIGGGYFIHAPRTGDFVKISRLADRLDYSGARRYAWQTRVGAPVASVSTTITALSGVR